MTTAHPSAVRAADEILANYGIIQLKAARDANAITCAHIIDRETGVGELVAALEQCQFIMRTTRSYLPDSGLFSKSRIEAFEAALEQASAALTRHRQRSQPGQSVGASDQKDGQPHLSTAISSACEAVRKHIKEAELDEVMNDTAVKSLTDDLCFVITSAITKAGSKD